MDNRKKNIITVAVCQFEISFGNLDYNLQKMESMLKEASEQHGADLVVFPECSTSGYNFSSLEEVLALAQRADGPTVERVRRLSRDYNCSIIFGMIEEDEGQCFNSAFLIEPDQSVQVYRKTHLPFVGLDRFVSKGDKLGFFESSFGPIGLMICYDLRFPEVARELALRGARIIVLPTELPRGGEAHQNVFTRARACENRVYIVYANRTGEENGIKYIGRSQIVNPMGEVLVEMGENEGIVSERIDLSVAEEKDIVVIPGEYETHLYKDRRPELYQTIQYERGDFPKGSSFVEDSNL